MFDKLKRSLTTFNMSIVFLVVTISFVTIFLFMQNLLYRDSQIVMKSLSYTNGLVYSFESKESYKECFLISYDLYNNRIICNEKMYPLTVEESNKLKEIVFNNDATGEINDNDRNILYRYIINKKIFAVGMYEIVLYDTTAEMDFLSKLGWTLTCVDIALVVVSFIVSMFLTNNALKPIKEALEKQKRFTEDASHELRTPLAVIKTNLDVLRSNNDEKVENQEKWINYIDDEIKRMTVLVDELLTLTRLDSGKNKEERATINLSEEVRKICSAYRKYVKKNKITMKVISEEDVYLNCEENKIRQLVNIFLDNAIKYNIPEGSISIEVQKKNNKAMIIFRDTGIGIDKSEQNKIFNRFYRGDTSRKEGGTGLGLSIASEILKQHKASIKVISELGKGSEFIITF